MYFEKYKSEELYKHCKGCEGSKPNIKKLRNAFEYFHAHIIKKEIGSAPFTFGQDFWPNMPDKATQCYDKLSYITEREEPISRKLFQEEADR